jgi:hypothetical protein
MKQKYIFALFVLFIGMLLPAISHAQIDPPPDPIDTPIDGGLSILLAAGVGYGVKKAYNKRKKNNDELMNISEK